MDEANFHLPIAVVMIGGGEADPTLRCTNENVSIHRRTDKARYIYIETEMSYSMGRKTHQQIT